MRTITRPARRTRGTEPSPLDSLVLTHYNSMTAPQMSAKFGYHAASFHDAAKRVGVKLIDSRGRNPEKSALSRLTATEVVQQHHQTMTVYEMMEKFGFSQSHLQNTAKALGVKIKPKKAEHAKSTKPVKVVKPRVKVAKPEPVKAAPAPPLKKAPVKARKESNYYNPSKVEIKAVQRGPMRTLPVGLDNQYFEIHADATPEEIEEARERRVHRIEEKRLRERIKPL